MPFRMGSDRPGFFDGKKLVANSPVAWICLATVIF